MLLQPLIALILAAAVAAAAAARVASPRSPYYRELPASYRRQFESSDRFSTIVQFVREAQLNASRGLACPGKYSRSRFPLAAFQVDAEQPSQQVEPLSYAGFEQSQQSALSIANLFNNIYQMAKKPFDQWFQSEVNKDAFWYSVASSVVASDRKIFGCYIALFTGPNTTANTIPHAYRNGSDTVVIDSYPLDMYFHPGEPGLEWLTHHVTSQEKLARRVAGRPSQRMRHIRSKNLLPFTVGVLKDLDSQVKVVTEREGFWSPPVFACRLQRWLFTYAVPFLTGSPADLKIKGWVVLEFNLMDLEINQCANDTTFRTFYSSDVCNQATTECVHIPGEGFTDANFMCRCRRFFHQGNFTGQLVRQQSQLHRANQSSNYTALECGPCPADCPDSCNTDGRCLIKYNLDTLRSLPLVIQTFCITVCLLVAGIVFRTRKNRVIKAAVWILLEIFLLGVAMLYTTVFLMYLKPSYEICFIIPWFREIGFAVTYGTLVVKIYRILCGFQSRKAHRVHVRDRDLLKYLAGIVTVAVGFMAAWTAATLDHGRRLGSALQGRGCSPFMMAGQLVLEDGQTASEDEAASREMMGFRVCAIGYWDAVCATGELAFLVLGLFYCYCVRSAPSDCAEIRCITAAFVFELLVSLGYHVARHFVRTTLHPDYVYLMYFARCHLTVTVTVALVMGPRLWYVHSPPKNAAINSRSLVYSQVEAPLGEAISPMAAIASNGDVEALEMNITDMNPEDIRAELKRLYTQLEVLKTKVMRKENPHISKRKGGRKQTHRRD